MRERFAHGDPNDGGGLAYGKRGSNKKSQEKISSKK